MEDVKKVEKILGVVFKNKKYIEEALTHRSYLNEHREVKTRHNERLEFLGDAVLELIVTEYLFKNYDKQEGELTSWRAALVKGESLAEVADKLGIEKFLRMSKGERADVGRARRYRLANMMEAVIGAIFIDRGYKVARDFVEKNIIVKISEIIKSGSYLDAKSHFQQKAQEQFHITPHYDVLKESGPDHDKTFLVGVFIGDEMVASGEGPSKQEAQREAARNGLKEKGWIK